MIQNLKDSKIQYLKNLYDCIKQRCYNSNNPSYKNYGERGIVLVKEWKNNRKKFVEDILISIGHRPSASHQLDRIDVNGNYEIKNIRWATPKENNRNKRNNNSIKIGNQTKLLKEWTEESGLNPETIVWRIENNWTQDKILQPVKLNNKQFDGFNLRSTHYNIMERCYNPDNINYKNYGLRGITMYEPWQNNYKEFKKYIVENIGIKPSSKYHLDRINNNSNYEPNNIRWATPQQNSRNRRNNNLIKIGEEEKTLIEWSGVSGVNRSTIQKRISLGHTGIDLLSVNLNKKFNSEQVENIKELHVQGVSMRKLTKQFKCAHTTILDVIHSRGAYKNEGK